MTSPRQKAGQPHATVSVALSDVGRKRNVNEDAFFRDDAMGFYVVADGVGGHNKGEIASREAIDQLRMWVYGARNDLDKLVQRLERGDGDARWEIRRLLENGVQSACYMVYGMAELDPEKRGMSTTVSALLVRGGFAFAAHVGDSRVYRIRGGTAMQITEDHTLINYKLKHGLMTRQEAETASGKNVITRAVGHKDYVQVDTGDVDAAIGDRFFMCTDGLHTYLRNDSELIDLVADDSLESGCAAAVALANQRGGRDNITVLAIEVQAEPPREPDADTI
jgi:serine/threonine protein phosphatase PrpC